MSRKDPDALWHMKWDGLWRPACLIRVQPRVRPAFDRRSYVQDLDDKYCFAAGFPAAMQHPSFKSVSDVNMLTWLRFCSWGVCSSCGTLTERSLTQAALNNPLLELSKLDAKCWRCATAARKLYPGVPANSIPLPLQNLAPGQERILRPLVLHQGNPTKAKHGYMKKDRRSALSWEKISVSQKIINIRDRAARKIVQAAYDFLMGQHGPYSAFVKEHELYLSDPIGWTTQHRQQTGQTLLAPWSIMEPYLEAALWPSLYWTSDMCDSACHAPVSWSRPFTCTQESMAGDHRSGKASFVAKVLSPTLDYMDRYDLLQWQFDVYIYRTIVATAVVAKDADIGAEAAMNHRPWTAGYWRRHHRQLIDAVVQYGVPDYFGTISPYEWSFPWPYWLDKAREVLHREPTELGSVEVKAMAHALECIILNYMCGKGPNSSRWRTHVFGAEQGDLADTVLLIVDRNEFQEGKHLSDYDRGRGSLHCHYLIWHRTNWKTALPREILAHVPEEDVQLAAIATRVQKSHTAGHAPVYCEHSCWTWNAALQKFFLRVHRPAKAQTERIRPFLKRIMRILRCQQDFQWQVPSAGAWTSGILFKYVSGYVTKMSEGWSDDWTDSALSPWQMADRVTKHWRPWTPMMFAVLSKMPFILTNATSITFECPYPPLAGDDDPKIEIALYRIRPPEQEELCFRDWRRLVVISGTSRTGHIAQMRRCKTTPVLLGLMTCSCNKDEFWYQWLLTHQPHRRPDQLIHSDAYKVQPCNFWFCCAWRLRPDVWGSADGSYLALQHEGHRHDYISTLMARLNCQRSHVQSQLDGTWPVDPQPSEQEQANASQLTTEQQLIFDQWASDLQKVLNSNHDSQCVPQRPHTCRGLPGSGKSYLLVSFLLHALQIGARVAVGTPSALQGTPYRQLAGVKRTGTLTVKTAHKLFNFPLDASAWWDIPDMMPYDVVVVDEMSQLLDKAATHIVRTWLETERRFLLILVGDLQQLAPIDKSAAVPRNITHSGYWNMFRHHFLREPSIRVKDPALLEFMRHARQSVPTATAVAELVTDRQYSLKLGLEAIVHEFFQEFPDGLILTCTLKGAKQINEAAAAAMGGRFLGQRNIWDDGHAEACNLYAGMPLMITRNLDEESGLVNGARALLVETRNECLHVKLTDGRHRLLWPVTDQQCPASHKTFSGIGFPVMPAYACTVHKVQGATLPAAAIWFEEEHRQAPVAAGLGYVAVSRVAGRHVLRFIGKVSPCSFIPVSLD